MKSIRTFNPNQLHHNIPPPPPLPFDPYQSHHNINIPTAPPPPPLPSPVAKPAFQIGQANTSNDAPLRIDRQYTEDREPSFTNFVATGSPYLRLFSQPDSSTTEVNKKMVKSSVSLPIGKKQYSDSRIPSPPPLPHLPIRRQPSQLLREIRGNSKRLSAHNLGFYHGLRHVETVEKRAFRVGRVIGEPVNVVTTQDLIKSFHKKFLNPVKFLKPLPSYPVGRVVTGPPVHVPKMKAHFSATKKSVCTKKHTSKIKKGVTTPPEDKLPRIPTPPLDDVKNITKSKPMSKKSGFMKHKK